MHKPDANDLDIMKTQFATKKVAPVIDRCYPLSDVVEAIKYYESGQVKGKIVISIVEDS